MHCPLFTRSILILLLLVFARPIPGFADVSTLTLDGLSFISFQDEVTNPIPGGTLQFNFGVPNPDGSIPFTIAENNVALLPVTISSLDASLQYALAGPATGLMSPTPTGRMIVFNGVFSAEDIGAPGNEPRTYMLAFSTETAFAQSLDGSETVERSGSRIAPSSTYVQLVGATVNEAENLHGAAVYMVLSGTFDQLP